MVQLMLLNASFLMLITSFTLITPTTFDAHNSHNFLSDFMQPTAHNFLYVLHPPTANPLHLSLLPSRISYQQPHRKPTKFHKIYRFLKFKFILLQQKH